MPKPAARVTDMTQHGGIIMPPCALVTMIENLPAARLTDMHTCPMVTGIVPHVGGPIILASFTVFIENLPAARVQDMLTCVGPPDMIQMGAMVTFIGDSMGGGMSTISPPKPPAAPGAPSAPAAPSAPPAPGAPPPGAPADGTGGAPADKCTTEGDPIDVATGRVFVAVEDFTSPGKPAFTFGRFYNTANAAQDSPFGFGWTHSLAHSLAVEGPFLVYQDAEGRRVLFPHIPPDEEYLHHLDENITLRRIAGRYRVDMPDGRQLHFTPLPEGLETSTGQSGQKRLEGGKAYLGKIVDAQGRELTLTYRNGLLHRLADTLGNEYEFISDGRRIQTLLFHAAPPAQNTNAGRNAPAVSAVPLAHFQYDANGNLAQALDALGYGARYTYDAAHRLTQRMNRVGAAFQYQYDHKSRCIRAWGPDHVFDQTFFYHETEPQTAVRDVNGKITTYHYNGLGMVTQVVNAQGGTRRFTYQGANLVGVTDELGRVTQYAYDKYARLTKTLNAGGAEQSTAYFPRGLRQDTDAAGNILTLTPRDGAHVLHLEDDLVPLVTATPGPGPRHVTFTDAGGQATLLTYDQADRVIAARHPLGQTYRFAYDAFGNRAEVTDPTGAIARFTYDTEGRLTCIEREGGSSFGFAYDGEGNLTQFVDGNGQVTRFEHARFERLTRRTDPNGNSIAFEYDAFNRLRRMIDGRGNPTLYDYDELGRLQRVLHPDGLTEFFTFDPAGQLRRALDRGGMAVDCEYDADGHLTGMRALDGTQLTFTYDKNGRILSATNAETTVTFAYDKLGRLTGETQNEAALSYEYDRSGYLTALTLPNDRRVTFGYDANGRLERVEAGNGLTHTFAHADSGPLQQHRYPNGLVAKIQRSRLGLPMQIGVGREQDPRPIMQCGYRYDANDALIAVSDAQFGQTSYRYDRAGRLQSAQPQSAPPENFTYDADGNILSQTADTRPPDARQYSAANQFQGGGKWRIQHDARGQVTQIEEEGQAGARFAYNGQGLLTQAVLPDGSTVEYTYDAFARRLSKKVVSRTQGDREVFYAWAGDQLTSEVTFGPNDAEEQRSYLYWPGTFLPLAVIIGEEHYSIHADHRGAPSRVTDRDGNVVWLADYSAWGEARVRTAEITLNLRLPGQYYDAETGLHYNRARYYHPQWGRYLTPDPMGFAGGLNLYAYAENDPINRFDPMGTAPDVMGGLQSVGQAIGQAAQKAVSAIATALFTSPKPTTTGANPTAPTATPTQNSVSNAVNGSGNNGGNGGGTGGGNSGGSSGTGGGNSSSGGIPATGAGGGTRNDSGPPPPGGTTSCGGKSDAANVNAAANGAATGGAGGGASAPVCPPPAPPAGTPDANAANSATPLDPDKKYKIWDLHWEPAKGSCGDKVKVVGSTDAPDGTSVNFSLKAKQGSSPNLSNFAGTAAGGKITQEWEIKDVDFKSGTTFLDSVDIAAQSQDAALPSNEAALKVEPLWNAPEDTFTAERSWNGFTNHSEFKQNLDKFRNKISASFDIMKGWGGTYVDLSGAGITGKAGDCPWDGHRWARSTGLAMAPDQYYDGKNWVAMPDGFTVTASTYNGTGFYKSGDKFICQMGGSWPEAFADYDFDSDTYKKRRADWIQDTHDTWTDTFHVRRKDCKSQPATRCCRYEVEVTLTLSVVTSYKSSVILISAGNIRSNTILWSMDDDRIKVAAHETGHHLDNPDEYAGGAVDTGLNEDGAVSGIDSDCIMGQNLTNVKKRHYHAFADMTKKLVKSAYGRDYTYEVVDK